MEHVRNRQKCQKLCQHGETLGNIFDHLVIEEVYDYQWNTGTDEPD